MTYDVSARSGPSGEDATGQATATFPDGSRFFGGSVTCLNVDGNVALLKLQSTGAVIGLQSMRIPDNARSAAPDLVDVTLGAGPSNEWASPEPSYILQSTAISGDVVVIDRAPLPTVTAQRKNEGWKTYGVFKNQGDCVSWVATGGTSQPSGP